MAAPRTPSKARHVDVLVPSAAPPRPMKALSPLRTSSTTSLLSPQAAKPVNIFAPVSKGSTTGAGGVTDDWRLENGRIVLVNAPSHLRMLSSCSWLHQYEHARYLHAGLSQSAVQWPCYPYKIVDGVERDHLDEMSSYLAAALLPRRIKPYDRGLLVEVPQCESKKELEAAFKRGTIHFSSNLSIARDGKAKPERLSVRLAPPAAGMGSALYRRFGSDRFFRLVLEDDLVRRAGTPLDSNPSSTKGEDPIRSAIKTFFDHPLVLFGRQYRPFCWKDGTAVYWAESGEGLETISLVDFAQRYLDVELNGSMSVAKYAARFELGLTTTTPTVIPRREQVFRTPDINSDTLKLSFSAMNAICDEFRSKMPLEAQRLLPPPYVPSCIRGSVKPYAGAPSVEMVWQLDYATIDSPSSDVFIQLRPFEQGRMRPILKFHLVDKDGSVYSCIGPTTLKPVWVEGPPDQKEEVVMTDGCSLISMGAMRVVAQKLAASGREAKVTAAAMPTVAQGRIGPGKGVWTLAPRTPWNRWTAQGDNDVWIEVRDSQWKFKDHRTESFTFELHSVPSGKTGSKLGKQMFEVLAHCGVPTNVFREMLKKQIDEIRRVLWDYPDLPTLLYHVQRQCNILEDRTSKARITSNPGSLKRTNSDGPGAFDDDLDQVDEQQEQDVTSFVQDARLDPTSGAPNTVAEVVVEMLQSGFDPRQNPHLADKLKRVEESLIRKQISFRIADDYSYTAFVVADHLGILDEGQFFFQLSERPLDANGLQIGAVLGPALLTRSPAIQPCDIQKATGVLCEAYAAYCDVIIVSTKGERSLCSILSGGDYDGDKLVVMTNPELVAGFDSSKANPSFADPPFADPDWFEVDRRRVVDHVKPMIDSHDDAALARAFMEGLHAGTQYGVLSVYHTTLAYTLGLDHPLTSEAGHLFCKALDGRKQGFSFSPDKWKELKATFFEPSKDKPRWTLCEDGKTAAKNVKYAKRPAEQGKHVMDELIREGEKAVDAAKMSCLVYTVEGDLADPWTTAWEPAANARHASPALFDDLCVILEHVKSIYAQYRQLFSEWRRDRELRDRTECAAGAPGSPTKSPSKSKEWSGSSKNQKEALLQLSKRFWSLVVDNAFQSAHLQGPAGAANVRVLMASCAYIEPLVPTFVPPANGVTLLRRLQDASPARPPAIAVTEALAISTSSSEVTVLHAKEVTVPKAPAAEDVEMEDSYGDDGLAWSQIPDDLTQAAVTSLGSTSSSQTATVVVSSSHPSNSTLTAPPSPAAAPRSPAKAPPAYSSYRARPFRDVAGRSEIRFCYDMAHRDVLALRADSLTRALHGDNPGATGIQAPKITPHILDVLQVAKRCATLAQARTKVRPRTLLKTADDSPPVSLGSPAKKARWT
ncbi:hypothetical protein JCM10049v2_004798 [Rhodotorula toruloides]